MDPRVAIPAYVKNRLFTEIENGPRGTAAAIAKATDISTAHIANLKNGKADAGEDAARALAAYWKVTYAELEALAVKWAAGNPELVKPAERTVEYDPRYPNLKIAADFARADGLLESAVVAVERTVHDLKSDPAPSEWLRKIREEDIYQRRQQSDAQAREREARKVEADRLRAAEMEKQTKPKLPKRKP